MHVVCEQRKMLCRSSFYHCLFAGQQYVPPPGVVLPLSAFMMIDRSSPFLTEASLNGLDVCRELLKV